MEHLAQLTINAVADGLTLQQENISSNNGTTVPVDGPKAAVYSVTKAAGAVEGGALASVEIYNGTAEERTSVVCAAAYDADGKMLDVHFATYVTAAGESTSVTLPLSGGTDVEHVRFFLLNTDLSPAELPETIKIR